VIDIDGDGSFLMTSFELPTLARYALPVKVAIISNHYLGMVKQWQDLFYQRRYSASKLHNPDFAGMAEACGVRGMKCGRKEDVAATVEAMLAHAGPVVAEFEVEGEEHVYPIVGPGKGLHEMHMGTLERLDF
jgi:acetolactate synthase-1/2/3 large subunit